MKRRWMGTRPGGKILDGKRGGRRSGEKVEGKQSEKGEGEGNSPKGFARKSRENREGKKKKPQPGDFSLKRIFFQ